MREQPTSNNRISIGNLTTVLSASSTLCSVSIAMATYLHTRNESQFTPISDDMFITAAVGFLMICYLDVFLIHNIHKPFLDTWFKTINILFLLFMTVMVVAAMIVLFKIL